MILLLLLLFFLRSAAASLSAGNSLGTRLFSVQTGLSLWTGNGYSIFPEKFNTRSSMAA
jgi:hypothetical protein